MKSHILIVILLMLTSASAWSYTKSTADFCRENLTDGELIHLELNDLIITSKNRIFWKTKPVVIFHNEGQPVVDTRVYISLLTTLLSNPYQVFSEQTLYKTAIGARADDGVVAYITNKMTNLRLSFKKVDEKFDAIHGVLGEGYVWDDGHGLKNLVAIPEIKIQDNKIFWHGRPLEMRQALHDLAKFMYRKRESPVSNLELYNLIREKKSDEIGPQQMQVLNTHVTAIRKALRDAGAGEIVRIKTMSNGTRVMTINHDARARILEPAD